MVQLFWLFKVMINDIYEYIYTLLYQRFFLSNKIIINLKYLLKIAIILLYYLEIDS